MLNSHCAIRMLQRVHEILSLSETNTNSTYDFDRKWDLIHAVFNRAGYLSGYYLNPRLYNQHQHS